MRRLALAFLGLSLSACSEMPKLPKAKGPQLSWNTAMQSIPAPVPSGEVLPPGSPWPPTATSTETKK